MILNFKPIISEAEARKCYSLMHQLRTHLSENEYLTIFKNAVADGYSLTAAVNDEQKIIGLIGFRFLQDFVHGKHLYIDDLVTDVNLRSKGIGAQLLKYAEKIAAENGCKQIRLCTGIENENGKRFYAREGWNLRAIVYKKKIGIAEQA